MYFIISHILYVANVDFLSSEEKGNHSVPKKLTITITINTWTLLFFVNYNKENIFLKNIWQVDLLRCIFIFWKTDSSNTKLWTQALFLRHSWVNSMRYDPPCCISFISRWRLDMRMPTAWERFPSSSLMTWHTHTHSNHDYLTITIRGSLVEIPWEDGER